MKHLNVRFSDEAFAELRKEKRKKDTSWRNFILKSAGVSEEGEKENGERDSNR